MNPWTRFALVVFVLVPLGCQPKLRDHIAKGDGFAVKLPGKPSIGIQKTAGPYGPIEYRAYSVKVGPVEYMVTANELPATFPMGPFSVSAQDRLAGAVEGTLKSGGGKLVDQKDVSLLGHPGKEIIVEVPEAKVAGGGTYQARIFVVGRKFYQVAIAAPKDQFPHEIAREVFDSFALLDSNGQPIRAESTPVVTLPVATSPVSTGPAAPSSAPEFQGGSFARPPSP